MIHSKLIYVSGLICRKLRVGGVGIYSQKIGYIYIHSIFQIGYFIHVSLLFDISVSGLYCWWECESFICGISYILFEAWIIKTSNWYKFYRLFSLLNELLFLFFLHFSKLVLMKEKRHIFLTPLFLEILKKFPFFGSLYEFNSRIYVIL